MYIATILGALIGFFTLSIPGLLIGGLVGYFFDRGRQSIAWEFSAEQRAHVEKAFFNALFPVMGHIAKADGRVSEEEIQGAEQLFVQMQLSSDQRQQAIELFRKGARDEIALAECMSEFADVCGNYRDLKQLFVVYLISIALADGRLDEAEESMLSGIAGQLGYSAFAFNHLLGMVKAQFYFQERHQGQQGGHDQARPDALENAYQALGVNADASDAEVKKAYRKLMSEYHPDKLAGKGVPEHVIKMATEKSQDIREAYDTIRKARGK